MHPENSLTPAISVIVPVRNGEKRLPSLFGSLEAQNYAGTIEVLIVDDDSDDGTANLAKQFGARLIRNGARDCERGKAIGIESASHELLLFLDDDNQLPHPDWIGRCVEAFLSEDAFGAQPAWFHYDAADTPADRYQSLFGGTDPILSYLGFRDRLGICDKKWHLSGTVLSENGLGWLVQFDAHNVPTLGAQGFIARKTDLLQTLTNGLFFHGDACRQLIASGKNRMVILKMQVIHHHADSFRDIMAKMHRNIRRFFNDSRVRGDRYGVPLLKRVQTGLILSTGVIPAFNALLVWLRTRDVCALMHPIVCWSALAMFVQEAMRYKLQRVGSVAPGEKVS